MKSKRIAYAVIFMASIVSHSPDAWSKCNLNIQKNIFSGWSKENVVYRVNKNTLDIEVAERARDDADSIYIGSIKGCSTLTVDISKIRGDYPWDGKIIGISFAFDEREPHQWGNFASFAPPRGHAIDDGFVKTGAWKSRKLVYDIDNVDQTTYIGAKVFIGSNNALELQFSAEEMSSEPRLSARKPPRPVKSYAVETMRQSGDPGFSCADACHEPRTARRQSIFASVFSRLSNHACLD